MLFKSTINETFNKAGRVTEEKCSSRRKGGTMGKKDVVSKIYLGAERYPLCHTFEGAERRRGAL